MGAHLVASMATRAAPERTFCTRATALEALASVMGRSPASAVLVLASPG